MELVYSGFEQHLNKEGASFFPFIYSGKAPLPTGFNTGIICLDASERSTLKWEYEEAALYPYILWELDFALDENIVSDEARYLALELAIDHFAQTVLKAHEAKTVGVALYRGALNSTLLDPLQLLASRLPQSVRPFIFLDTTDIADATTYFQAINQVTLGSLLPILKGKWPQLYPYAFPALAWDHACSPLGVVSDRFCEPLSEKKVERAVLMPEKGSFPIPEGDFRLIPEALLTHEWDGVDQLLVDPSSVHGRCQRKLKGFEAAGGEVIFISSRGGGEEPQLPETSRPSYLDALPQTDR